eukprot:CAMPEP_0177209196 /NCGR_PEP_ID=MMETSP0367-20130122/30893_1 /TAXON_ID=447022 ORGANISM="Scrippsiella hangoei-like, Strain SHHI-4" /NCGR_SAMPLE_ID=MMETSP0367 /ASSEMBLY_ACC=CAM_ASM_000362 /LENGTH=64 /DNA_ID=CAMNT_0018658225 /DNA_START=272 /DNA_END=463 /DNA_ORIENTATION=+
MISPSLIRFTFKYMLARATSTPTLLLVAVFSRRIMNSWGGEPPSMGSSEAFSGMSWTSVSCPDP